MISHKIHIKVISEFIHKFVQSVSENGVKIERKFVDFFLFFFLSGIMWFELHIEYKTKNTHGATLCRPSNEFQTHVMRLI